VSFLAAILTWAVSQANDFVPINGAALIAIYEYVIKIQSSLRLFLINRCWILYWQNSKVSPISGYKISCIFGPPDLYPILDHILIAD
jgi:hypothetical protein